MESNENREMTAIDVLEMIDYNLRAPIWIYCPDCGLAKIEELNFCPQCGSTFNGEIL